MTTLATMQTGDGLNLGFVMAIEGYEYLLVDGSDEANVAADVVSTSGQGWNGTDWTQALSGLIWNPTITRQLTPWQHKFDVPTLSVTVMGMLHAEQFCVDVAKTGAGNQTELAANLAANGATVTVQDTSAFSATGSIWIGTERITYTGKTAGTGVGDATFTGCTRGYLHPFATKSGTANRFGRRHYLPSADWDVVVRSKVTDAPRDWIGRHVGVWAHAIRNGVWDTVANAQLVWAGTITDLDNTEKGNVVIELEDMAGKLRNTTLFREQFRGRVAEGINVVNTYGSAVNIATATTNSFDVVAGTVLNTAVANSLRLTVSGETQTYDIPPAYYTASELASQINEWLANDGSILQAWGVEVVNTSDGPRTRISLNLAGSGYAGTRETRGYLTIWKKWAEFLGFTQYESTTISGSPAARFKLEVTGTGSKALYSDEQPARVWIDLNDTLNLDGAQGTWINEPEWLPQDWQDGYVDTSEQWGVLQLGQDVYALARHVSDTEFEIKESKQLTRMFGGQTFESANYRIAANDGGRIEVRQIVVLEGNFADIINRLFYGTGAANYNATTYDEWPADISAGFPGSLLSTNFEASVNGLTQSSAAASIVVVLSEATPLEKVIGAELLFRGAYLAWDAGYEFVTPQNTGATAAHTLNETNKRSAMAGDPQATIVWTTRSHVKNVLQIKYNLNQGTGKFRDTVQVMAPSALHENGTGRSLEIEARNSYGQYVSTGQAVEALTADLVTQILPLWAKPIQIARRTIGPAHYQGVKIGDILDITDDDIRDSTTGLRGVSGLPAVLFKHTHSWGGHGRSMLGEVEFGFANLDDQTIYSPAAYLASYSDPTATFTAHTFTESTEAVDLSFFANSDKAIICERDPTDPTSAQSWSVTLSNLSGNNVDVGTLTGYDASKSYVMFPEVYTTAVASQRGTAFMADDADLQILDSRRPYIWGANYNGGAFTALDATALPESYAAEWYGDGASLSAHQHRCHAVFLANYINYKSAIQAPQVFPSAISTPSAGKAEYVLMYRLPLTLGTGYANGQTQRAITIAPMFRVSSAGQAGNLRVTICKFPPASDTNEDVQFIGAIKQVTFTTSSATYEVATAQTLVPVATLGSDGKCYLIVEGQSPNSSTLDWLGFAKLSLGAFS